jgi:hypothetical protein
MAISMMINTDVLMKQLMDTMNREMMEAAEPVIRKAVAEAELEMRRKLAGMFVSMFEQSFNMERNGSDLRILVKHVYPDSK